MNGTAGAADDFGLCAPYAAACSGAMAAMPVAMVPMPGKSRRERGRAITTAIGPREGRYQTQGIQAERLNLEGDVFQVSGSLFHKYVLFNPRIYISFTHVFHNL